MTTTSWGGETCPCGVDLAPVSGALCFACQGEGKKEVIA